jgi:hypothetical protein
MCNVRGTCGLVGRLGAGLGLVASVHMVLHLVTSVVLDGLHQEGLILNLCFGGIPQGPISVISGTTTESVVV